VTRPLIAALVDRGDGRLLHRARPGRACTFVHYVEESDRRSAPSSAQAIIAVAANPIYDRNQA
jgi:hypothetical protein